MYLSAERKVRKKAELMCFPNLDATFGMDSLFLVILGEIMQEYCIHLQTTVPHSPWQNCGSLYSRTKEICLQSPPAPVRLWTYCATWCTAVQCFAASSIPKLIGRVPETHMNSSMPDISALILFDWYHLVYYLTPTHLSRRIRSLLGASSASLRLALTRWRFTSSWKMAMSSFVRMFGPFLMMT
jgi:hypothetical protein